MGLTDKILTWAIKDKDDISKQLGGALGSVLTFFTVTRDNVAPTELWTAVSSRGLGSSFILNHVGGLNWLGPEFAGSVAVGSQPYLGDSRGSWAYKSISSPQNSYREYFIGSRFKSGATTATGWGTGSVVFAGGGGGLTSGLSFDGNDYVKLPDAGLGSVSLSGLSIEAWVYPMGSTVNFPKIFEIERDDGDAALAVLQRYQTGSLVQFGVRFLDNSFGSVTSVSGVPCDQWSHLAASYDYNSGSMYLFMDGSLNAVEVWSPGQTIHPFAGSPRNCIGATGLGDSNFFVGRIDEVRVTEGSRYNTAFTPQNTQFSVDGNTLGLWHLNSIDNAAGSIVTDETGVYNGSVHGAVLIDGSVGLAGDVSASSEDIYLGGSTISSVKLTTTGSQQTTFTYSVSADGGANFTTAALGSTISPTVAGSALRWKATGATGILTRLQADYNLG